MGQDLSGIQTDTLGGVRNRNFIHNPEAKETTPATGAQAQTQDDADSLYGNARFVAPKQGDFSVSADSPALRIGFKNFPMSGFGVTSARLKALAPFPPIRLPQSAAPNAFEKTQHQRLLGAEIKSLTTDAEVSSTGMFSKSGVFLVTVPAKSQMSRYGFVVDDVVLAIDGKKTPLDKDLVRVMKELKAGEHTAKVWRCQEEHTFTFSIGHR
ncbi:hypothetical protein ACFLS1_10260 [Verrucomicrobiota bacterium]